MYQLDQFPAENPNKVYVKVHAEFMADGTMCPRDIIWEDDEVYKAYPIDLVLDIQQGASREPVGQDDRYVVLIYGHKKQLFFERNHAPKGNNLGRWYVIRTGQ